MNNCVNYLSEKLQHVRIFAFDVPCSLLNVPVMLLSFHVFLIITRGQVFLCVSFAPYKKGIAVLNCFTEVSQGQRLEKGIECYLFPATTNESGLGWGCCSASQNPGPQFVV